jgi:hypothetical protein
MGEDLGHCDGTRFWILNRKVKRLLKKLLLFLIFPRAKSGRSIDKIANAAACACPERSEGKAVGKTVEND